MEFILTEKNYAIEVYETIFKWKNKTLKYQIRMVFHTMLKYWSVGYIIRYGKNFKYFCYPNRNFLQEENTFRGKNRKRKARELANRWMKLVDIDDIETISNFHKEKISEG